MTNNRSYYIIIIGLFLSICAPTLWSEGMFMDGLYYASIARNLSEGIGSFWYLHHTQFSFPIFHEHPPLAIGIQSVFFYIFGDNIYIERIYSLSTFIITGIIIHQIWKEISSQELKKFSWIALALWVIIPLNSWACSNNILENTMNIFVSLSVLFLLKSYSKNSYQNIFVSGLMICMAFLSKGFVGLFTLSFFFWHYIIFGKIKLKEMILKSLFLVFSVISPFVLFYFFYPSANESIYKYINQQVIKSISQIQTVDTRFFILKRFILDLAPALAISLILFYMSIKKQIKLSIKDFKYISFFSLLGASGVLPIMISLKQSSFYILTVFPLFSLALAKLVAPYISTITNRKTNKIYITSICVFLTSVFLSIKEIGVIGRDHKILEDTKLILSEIANEKVISIDEKMSKNYQLIGYFSRYGNISLDKKEKHKFHIKYNEGSNMKLENYEPYKLKTAKIKLFIKSE